MARMEFLASQPEEKRKKLERLDRERGTLALPRVRIPSAMKLIVGHRFFPKDLEKKFRDYLENNVSIGYESQLDSQIYRVLIKIRKSRPIYLDHFKD